MRVVTATESVSQSTCTAAISSIDCDQPLVAQVADGERLGRLAEGHQRDDLALVDVERERMFAGDGGGHRFAALVDRLDVEGERAARRG